MRISLILIAAFLLAGCCRIPQPEMPHSNADLLSAMRQPGDEIPTFRGELRVDHMGPEGRIAGKVYAFASSGGRLRLQAVSPLDTTLRTATVDGTSSGENFTMVDQESQRCLRGRAEPCLVGEAVGLELSAEHVAAALLGAVPVIRHRSVSQEWNRCGYFEVVLTGETDGWVERIQLSPEQGRLVATRAEIEGPDGTVLEIVLDEYELSGDRLVPQFLGIRMPQSEAHLRVEWREIEVGVTLPDGAWRTMCPAGFTEEIASCQPRSTLPELEPPGGMNEAPVEPDGEPGETDAQPDGGVEPDGGGEPDGGTDPEEPDLSEELGL